MKAGLIHMQESITARHTWSCARRTAFGMHDCLPEPMLDLDGTPGSLQRFRRQKPAAPWSNEYPYVPGIEPSTIHSSPLPSLRSRELAIECLL